MTRHAGSRFLGAPSASGSPPPCLSPAPPRQLTLTWRAPHKGEWRGLHDHFPRALTPEYRRLLFEGMTTGQADYFARYGLPGRTMRPEFVNGRVFIAVEPLVGPFSERVPPAPLLWLGVRLLPAFRRRAAAAERALADRIWLAEAERWYRDERPVWEARNRALAGVDPPALGDTGLVEHLRAVRAHAGEGYRTHFAMHGTDLAPTAIYLTRSADWGIDAATATALLAGCSPASTGARGLPDWTLVTGYDLDERAACELPAREAAESRTASAPPTQASVAGSATGTSGSDSASATSGTSMASGVAGGSSAEEEVRAMIPPAHRAEWDRHLADARATYGVRDDNGVLTAAWPVGLLRRAMLAAGDRLVERGRLHRREHAVECTIDELVAMLDADGQADRARQADGSGQAGLAGQADQADHARQGDQAGQAGQAGQGDQAGQADHAGPGEGDQAGQADTVERGSGGAGAVGGAPSADAVADRADHRRALSAHAAPAVLGPEATLPVDVLPPAMRLMTRGLLTLRDLAITPPGARASLQGVGIGERPVQGRACVAADPVEALTRFEPGDVIVTAGTTPAWNTVLALAGGVVTEEGGPLSHAAVIARELGLPALVGTAEAVALIPDGATVELDPVGGTVRVLPHAPSGE